MDPKWIVGSMFSAAGDSYHRAMRPIRIALAQAPDGLRSAVHRALVDEPDLLVVAEVSGEVATLLEAGRADVVIVGMTGDELPALAERLVDEYPRIGVLAVDMDRRQGLLYRPRPELTSIAEVTPASLVAAIRRAAEATVM